MGEFPSPQECMGTERPALVLLLMLIDRSSHPGRDREQKKKVIFDRLPISNQKPLCVAMSH